MEEAIKQVKKASKLVSEEVLELYQQETQDLD